MCDVYKGKFTGNKPAPNGIDPDPAHVAPGASKKTRGKAPGSGEDNDPKTAEVLA